MKLEHTWRVKRLIFGAGFSSNLWHLERKNDAKVIKLFGMAYCHDFTPNKPFRPSLVILTLLWFTCHIGIINWNTPTQD